MASCTLESPTKPFMPYFGGKSRIAKRLACMMPKHDVYVEPFLGGGSVFFAKDLAKKNVLNDLNQDVVKVFSAARNKPSAFTSCKIRNDKSGYKAARQKSNRNVCDVLTLYKTSYSGMGNGFAKKDRRMLNRLNDTQKGKLKKAVILNEDFRKVMKRYDGRETLHYLDPPYVKEGGAYHKHGVTAKEVCDAAKQMKGKVMISYDVHPEVRRACKGFNFHKVSFPYSATKNGNGTEYIITNY